MIIHSEWTDDCDITNWPDAGRSKDKEKEKEEEKKEEFIEEKEFKV